MAGSGLASSLQARSELPSPTRPNHQPLRRPRSPHIEHPRFLAFVFALGGHAPGPHKRYHRELQPFAEMQLVNLMLSCAGSNTLEELRRS